MRPRSFRLRLALFSAVSAAVGLFVFGAAVAGLWRKDRIQRLDENLTRRGNVLASVAFPGQSWDEIYKGMQSLIGEEQMDATFLGIRHASDGTLIYQSPNWPPGLQDAASYPASAETFEWRGSTRDFLRPRRRPPNQGAEPNNARPRQDPTANRPSDEERRSRRDFFSRRGPPSRTLTQPVFYELEPQGQEWRMGVFGNTRVEVLLGTQLGEINRELKSLWLTFATASSAALALIALGAWLLSRKALTPIEALTDATRKVSASDLSQRIDLPRADREFVPLIQVYNRMMERLEASFHQARRFSADASHELKTPVAIMQGTLERALAEAPPGSREQEVYTTLLEETDHQQAILQSLLLLSQADAGKLRLSDEQVSLSSLANHAVDDAEMMVEDSEISLSHTIEPDLHVQGDSNLIQQVLHNLLTNAVKYNHPKGWIRLTLRALETDAVLQVANSGEPIPEDAQNRLFERFFRFEAARSDRTEGIGLGLSLSLEITRAHGGTLQLAHSTAEETVFELRLPLAKTRQEDSSSPA